MRRSAAGIALLIVVCAVPVASVRAQTASSAEIEAVPSGIVKLLGDYGRAFVAKDRALMESTLDPALRDSELRAFDNATDVPFRTFEVRAKTQYSGNLAYSRVRERYPGREVVAYQITEKTALDIESEAYEEDGAFTFVRDRPMAADAYDGWRLASKEDLAILGFFSPYHLWDTGPVNILRSSRFVLLTHPEIVDEMRPVLEIAERAYAKAAEFWPRTVTARYAILVPATTQELGRLIHATFDLGKFVAFVSAGANMEGAWVPTGPRVIVHLSHLRNYGAEGQLEIVAHELLHAFTRPISGPHVPVWVEEGLANAGGGRGARPSQAGSGPAPTEFPSDEEFLTGPVNDIIVRYDQSQVAIEVLIDRFGREALARFYEKLGSARVVPGTDEYHVRHAIRTSLDWTQDDWIDAWRERLG